MPELLQAPVRLCCGERHYGNQCHDGRVMCCLCFDLFAVEDLSVTPDGRKIDVCKGCAAQEKEMADGRPV